MDATYQYVAKVDLGILMQRIGIQPVLDIVSRVNIVCGQQNPLLLEKRDRFTRLDLILMAAWTLIHTWKPQNRDGIPEHRYISGGFIRDYICNGTHPNDLDFGIYLTESFGAQGQRGIEAYARSIHDQFRRDWPNVPHHYFQCKVDSGNYRRLKSCLIEFTTPTEVGLSTESNIETTLFDGNIKSMAKCLSAADVDYMQIDETGLSLKYEGCIFPHSTLDMAIANAYRKEYIFYPPYNFQMDYESVADAVRARGTDLERNTRLTFRGWQGKNLPRWFPRSVVSPSYELVRNIPFQSLAETVPYQSPNDVTLLTISLDTLPRHNRESLNRLIESYATMEYFGMEVRCIKLRQEALLSYATRQELWNTSTIGNPNEETLVLHSFNQALLLASDVADGTCNIFNLSIPPDKRPLLLETVKEQWVARVYNSRITPEIEQTWASIIAGRANIPKNRWSNNPAIEYIKSDLGEIRDRDSQRLIKDTRDFVASGRTFPQEIRWRQYIDRQRVIAHMPTTARMSTKQARLLAALIPLRPEKITESTKVVKPPAPLRPEEATVRQEPIVRHGFDFRQPPPEPVRQEPIVRHGFDFRQPNMEEFGVNPRGQLRHGFDFRQPPQVPTVKQGFGIDPRGQPPPQGNKFGHGFDFKRGFGGKKKQSKKQKNKKRKTKKLK
jgi:hypothetical protein